MCYVIKFEILFEMAFRGIHLIAPATKIGNSEYIINQFDI